MRVWRSVAALVALLAVPLLLALASQALAARPGPPPVPDSPVRLVVDPGGSAPGTPSPSTPAPTPVPSPPPTSNPVPAPAPAPETGPQVVEPTGPGVVGDGDGDGDTDDDTEDDTEPAEDTDDEEAEDG